MLIYISFLLGGIGRAFVGTGYGPRWIGRWSVYPPIALLSAYVGLNDTLHLSLGLSYDNLVMIWAALIASLNLGLGYTQWESLGHMIVRLVTPSIVLVSPLVLLGASDLPHALLYIGLSLLAAIFYPVRQRVFEFPLH